tara:strand:- start:224 stop:841 length:618 start_codon:yes stop_codon:yes gene_type:complete
MKDTIYLYTKKTLFNIIQEILLDYNIINLTFDQIYSSDFKNNNVLFVLDKDFVKDIKESFFINNNVVVFFSKKEHALDLTKLNQANFFYGNISVKKFIDEINTHLIFKKIIFNNTEIAGEKMTNLSSGLYVLLTPLEREILIVFFKNKKIQRNYFLEEILKLKKNIETKTVESHLTRIRKKLQKIESNIQITTKEDIFYINNYYK